MDPGEGTAKWLSEYGPWAVVVLCLIAIAVLWRRLIARDERAEEIARAHEAQLLAVTKEHKAEMAAVVDRLIASSNAQVEKFSNLADQNAKVVEALTRRVRPKGEGT